MTQSKRILDNPMAQFLLGAAIGAIGGHLANQAYESCTPEEMRSWARDRVMHHGTLGCLGAASGVVTGNPFLAGAGTGLALTDLADVDEWFSEGEQGRGRRSGQL